MTSPKHWNRAWKNLWKPGETAYFEYHCEMSHTSGDAQLWYRTHQPVTVIEMSEAGHGETRIERRDLAAPRSYRVVFQDGFVAGAMEDELLTHPKYWERRFNPPPKKEIEAHGGLSMEDSLDR